MKPPTTPEEALVLHKIRVADPARFIQIATEWIASDPTDSNAYFDRHFAWLRLGQTEQALSDISRSIELEPSAVAFWGRGDIYRALGDYAAAADNYLQGESIDPVQWTKDAFPLIYQADTYARLGDERKALDCCARLPDDFWTPGHNDLPPGGKAEIAAELMRRAAVARSSGRA
jgi:tetratricopeptide (TPR) repeat protein